MRAIIVERQGSPVAPNVRLVSDWPEPSAPGPGQAVVRTLATALNQMDLWVGRGVPGLSLTYPRVSGCDACGEVVAVGEGADKAWLGRQVIVNAALRTPDRWNPDNPGAATLAPAYELIGEHHNGMLAENFTVPVANLVAVRPDADPRDAAAFGLCFLTAWSMMVTKGGLRHGSLVLVTGIGGGVATSALAIARAFGCRVAVTSRSEAKVGMAKKLGAAFGVVDRGQDWSKEVRAWTNKRGVDFAVDSSGKATHLNCIRSLARGGTYLTPGCTSGPDAVTDLARVFWNQLRILGSTMGTTDELREVTALFNDGRLAPVVDRVFKAEQARAAYERLESAEQFGKVVIEW